MTFVRRGGRTLVLLLVVAARPALAQTAPATATPVAAARPISLADAIRIAEEQSE